MSRALVVCFLSLILLPPAARGCQCMLALSTCNEVGASDLVFIGTVELLVDRVLEPSSLVQSPAAGVIVSLQSDRVVRYVESDSQGRFVFDGLLEGDYKVSAFAHGYPVETRLLAEPERVHIAKKSCARQVLLLPKKEDN